MPTTVVELDLLGTRFSISVDDPTWSAVLRDLWGGFETNARTAGRPVTIETGPGVLRLGLPDQPLLDFDEPWTLAEVLRFWIAEDALKATSGLVLIHAAAVVRDGDALLLVGASGAGKTSLTLALLDAGWALGSDDVAPLDPSTGLVQPFPKPLGVRDPRLWRAVRHQGWTPPWPERPGSPILVPPRLFARCERPFRARWAAFIGFDPGASPRLEPLSGARTVATLAEHVRSLSPDALGAIADACRGVTAAAITYPSSAAALELLAGLTDVAIPPKTG